MRKNDWVMRTVGVCFRIALGLAPLMVVLPLQSEAAVSAQTKPNDAPSLPEPDGGVIPLVSDPEVASELEDRLVILPEIKREGERFFLSSFKLPDKLTFAGQSVPLDNWQVRERIEYEFYQFLEDQGESIILAKRTGRCFAPAEKQLADAGLPDDLKYMLLVESKCIAAALFSGQSVRTLAIHQFHRKTV